MRGLRLSCRGGQDNEAYTFREGVMCFRNVAVCALHRRQGQETTAKAASCPEVSLTPGSCTEGRAQQASGALAAHQFKALLLTSTYVGKWMKDAMPDQVNLV